MVAIALAVCGCQEKATEKTVTRPRGSHEKFFMLNRPAAIRAFVEMPVSDQIEVGLEAVIHEPADSSWLVRVGCRGEQSIGPLSAALRDARGDLFVAALIRALMAVPSHLLVSHDRGVLALVNRKAQQIQSVDLRVAVVGSIDRAQASSIGEPTGEPTEICRDLDNAQH